MMKPPSKNGIGRLNEYTIHAQLKELFDVPGAVLEAKVDNYIVDIVHGEQLIEIQTKNFSGIRVKLEKLLENHPVLLVTPLPAETYISVLDEDKKMLLYRRKSPKKNTLAGIVPELCRITRILGHPGLTLLVLLTVEEDIRINDGKGSWRRKGISLLDRKLVRIVEEHRFEKKEDFLCLLPPSLPEEFTNKDISVLLNVRPRIAQGISYCLKALHLIRVTRRTGNRQYFKLTIF